MLGTDKDLFFCDMVETYRIYEYEQLPVIMVAALAYGLRDNSRIKLAMSGEKVEMNTSLLLLILDEIRGFRWSFTEDAQNGANPPERIYDRVIHPEMFKKDDNAWTFEDKEEFDAKWKEINGV